MSDDQHLAPPAMVRETSLHNKQLPPEDPNDPFDRQRCILDWKQDVLERQAAFVLGCGGLGCTVAMMLCRLGVGKIYLLDKDVVEVSNLNRQLLFSRASVGQRKVDAAAEALRNSHVVGGTEIVSLHLDAVADWARVVETARQCTVLFNNIDVGVYFDYATLSLAKSLGIPYSAGSSYATTWIVEFFSARKGLSSFSLANKDGELEVFDRLEPDVIQTLESIDFIPPDVNPPTRSIGSNALVCASAGIMTVNMWAQTLMMKPEDAESAPMPNFTKFDIARFWEPHDTLAWPAPEE